MCKKKKKFLFRSLVLAILWTLLGKKDRVLGGGYLWEKWGSGNGLRPSWSLPGSYKVLCDLGSEEKGLEFSMFVLRTKPS